MMYYLIWVPLAFFFYFFETWLIVKSNTLGGRWFWYAMIPCCFPLWLLISRYSKDLLFDGMVYDVMIFLGCALAAGYFTGKFFTFTWTQWVGLALFCIGLFLVKYKW